MAPSTSRWLVFAMVLLLAVLGGMLPIVALIACLLARELWPPAPKVIALSGVALGGGVAVLGRILGNGQDWAYVPLVQAALLIAVSAVVAATFRPFGSRQVSGQDPEQTAPVRPVPARAE